MQICTEFFYYRWSLRSILITILITCKTELRWSLKPRGALQSLEIQSKNVTFSKNIHIDVLCFFFITVMVKRKDLQTTRWTFPFLFCMMQELFYQGYFTLFFTLKLFCKVINHWINISLSEMLSSVHSHGFFVLQEVKYQLLCGGRCPSCGDDSENSRWHRTRV